MSKANILTEEQKEKVNGMINELEMLLTEKDIGTNEPLSQKNIAFILLRTNITASELYLQIRTPFKYLS